jgi:hypothetical protein
LNLGYDYAYDYWTFDSVCVDLIQAWQSTEDPFILSIVPHLWPRLPQFVDSFGVNGRRPGASPPRLRHRVGRCAPPHRGLA